MAEQIKKKNKNLEHLDYCLNYWINVKGGMI